jgi:peptidyl-dipeptidase A
MILRKMLETACVVGAAVLLGGCDGAPPAGQTTAAAAPTAEEARQFVADAERELAELAEIQSRTNWVYETYITYDTEWLVQRANAASTAATVRLAAGAARFNGLDLDPETERKLGLLRLALSIPAPQRPGAAEELAEVETRMASRYSTGRIDYDGRQVTLDELETLMGTERDPAKLKEMWSKWREVSAPMAKDYARMVEIANEGARDLGYANVAELWLSRYDMPPDAMEREVERLWSQMEPFYKQLHCDVRAELNAHYGETVQPATGAIRADLLGNMWAQDWSTLYDLVAPPDSGPTYDLTQLLVSEGFDDQRMVKTAEGFYTSLGLPALPQTFWERSLFTRPRDRDVVCHASAWDLDERDDVRIKECIQINAEHFQTVHHELGHNYYQRAYQNQPELFRGAAHDGFHEAIGDFVALNATPEYLAEIGILPRSQIPPVSADTGLLMQRALEKIAFLPFALTMDQWRWRVFRGEIEPGDYNSEWWKLRLQYQGIRPPADRPADAFDPGAKFHIANNVSYLRYFLSYVMQFQFYQAACKQAGWEGPLHRCTIYGNQRVGERFAKMLEMGASEPWPDALEAFTGTRQMDASAMVAYFEPLMGWLQERNKGRTCGW